MIRKRYTVEDGSVRNQKRNRPAVPVRTGWQKGVLAAAVLFVTVMMTPSFGQLKSGIKDNNAIHSLASPIELAVVDSSIVFEPDTGVAAKTGYASMRIPALVRTNKGNLLAFCEGRVGTSSDWAEMDLLLRRSLDGGKNWQPAQIVAPRGQGPTSNATPIVSEDGTIHLLYQRDYAHLFYTKSTDEGKTWSAAVDITTTVDKIKNVYAWNVLAPGPGHGIQLKNGRLIAAIWLAASPVVKPKRKHGPSCVATIYSDDLGKSWKMGKIVADNSEEIKNPNESMLVELADGRVMINMRTGSDTHQRAVAYSPDGISDWSHPVFVPELFDPICMAGFVKITPPKRLRRVAGKFSSGKSWILFSNPDSRNIKGYPRRQLTLKLSLDGGSSWPVTRLLQSGPAGYSDLATDDQGNIYCLYETNTKAKGWNYSLVLKKISIRPAKNR